MNQVKSNRSDFMGKHIAACKASKLQVSSYCRANALKTSNYYYWQKKLSVQKPSKFISITPVLTNAPVSILFTNGKRIIFDTMPPLDYIEQLMK